MHVFVTGCIPYTEKLELTFLIQSLVGLLLGLEGGLAGLSLIIVFFLSSLFLLRVAVL